MRAPENTPAQLAREAGIDVPGRQLTWDQVVDAAVEAYWQRRPRGSRPALTEYRRRQMRASTSAETWQRRAGAA